MLCFLIEARVSSIQLFLSPEGPVLPNPKAGLAGAPRCASHFLRAVRAPSSLVSLVL